jgi:hypothetical protein
MEISGYAGPLYDGGAVFMAYSDGHVNAYKADGSLHWQDAVDLAAQAEQAAGGEAPRYLDVDTTPVPDDHPLGRGRIIYVASYAGGVYALDQDTGAIVWKNEKATGVHDLVLWSEPAHIANSEGPEAERGAMVPARKMLLAASPSSGLWALDPKNNGATIWRLNVPDGGITAPIPVAGALIVGTTRYGLFLISPYRGKIIDGLDVATGFAQAPAVFGHRAYAISNAGTLLGIQVEPPILRLAKTP